MWSIYSLYMTKGFGQKSLNETGMLNQKENLTDVSSVVQKGATDINVMNEINFAEQHFKRKSNLRI